MNNDKYINATALIGKIDEAIEILTDGMEKPYGEA